MSEKIVQDALLTILKTMVAFADADVVVNDWRILDGSSYAAPFIIIETSDEVISRQDSMIAETTYSIKVYLFEKFTTWKETLDRFTISRDAIYTLMNDSSTGNRAAGSQDAASTAINIEEVRTSSGVEPWYQHYVAQEDLANAVPAYLWQLFIFSAKEY